MASASSGQEHVKCGICLEIYREPRKLPGCSHSFCETCIVSFIDKLKAEDKLGLEYHCPICRLPSRSPEDKNTVKEWVKTLDRDSELDKRTVGQVELDKYSEPCKPCKSLNKVTSPSLYCLNCDASLCQGCSDIIHAIEQNKDHVVIDNKRKESEKYQKPALDLFSELLTCPYHPKNQLEFYCNNHKQVVCYKCATLKHRTCSSLKEVKNMHHFTLQSSLNKVSKSINAQKENVRKIISIYKQKEEENKINKETIHTDIEYIKQSFVNVLDSLEETLKHSCDAKIKNINIMYLDEIEDLDGILQQLKTVEVMIKTFVESAAQDQIFVCIERLKEKCSEIEKKVMNKGATVRIKDVHLSLKDALTSVLHVGPNDTTHLASVEEKETPMTLNFDTYTKRHEIKKIDSCPIMPKMCPIDPTYNDLLFLQNNDLLLIDSYHGYCCLANDRHKEIASKVFMSRDHSDKTSNFRKLKYATYLEKDMIAVSMCHGKKICLASLEDLSVTGTIDCTYKPRCMVELENNVVAISWDDPVAFGVIEIHNLAYTDKIYFIADKTGRILKSFDFMAVDKSLGNVVQPCKVDKTVYCFTLEGDPVFTYKSGKLKEPSGVAVDNDSNIYVCDIAGGNIHVISPLGLPVKIITEGCPTNPLAISFNPKGDKFAVSQLGPAYNWHKVHFFSLDYECTSFLG